jgi:tetratricopeptide (TPR) repeat protein
MPPVFFGRNKPPVIFLNKNSPGQPLALLGGWLIVLLGAVLAYWPGLSGPFVLDDFGSISKLGDLGGVRNWETFKAFVFGGTAGPTGRPLSLLTFLADAQDWPADSWPFKRTNLLIHLLNGVLLGLLISQVLAALKFDRGDARWIALVATGCWLLHPFLVSTTLYVVQRMAQLSTLFIFSGLVTYCYGRSLLAINARRAYLIMSVALVAGTLLAMISKENGILLPLLAGVLEITVFASYRAGSPRLNRVWQTLFITLPAAVVFIYLGQRALQSDFFSIVPPREFSIFERLLTQSRVLADYLQNWFIPKLYTTGVFQDHVIKSTGLFAPISTALSILFHGSVLLLAFARRRQWPLFALAALFFYGGHVLESTVLNLELYFEHRNYLSAAFLFLPLVAAMRARTDRKVFILVSLFVLCVLGGFTRYSSTVWKDHDSMVQASAQKAPTSARAQARFAGALFNAGYVDESLEVLDRALINVRTGRQPLLVNRLIFLCHLGRLDAAEFEGTSRILAVSPYDPRMINMYQELVTALGEEHCPNVPVAKLKQVFEGMLDVPPNNLPSALGYSQLKYFVGYVDVYSGEPAAALQAFLESLDSRSGATTAMAMASIMASNDYFEQALYLSDQALVQLDSRGAGALRGAKVSESDIRAFQEILKLDRANMQGAGNSDRVD